MKKTRARREPPPADVLARSPDSIRRLKRYAPDAFCGVYFLFEGDTCVYVGKSVNVHARAHTHMVQSAKFFDTYTWMPCDPSELDTWETHYIRLLAPKYNRSGILPGYNEMLRAPYKPLSDITNPAE